MLEEGIFNNWKYSYYGKFCQKCEDNYYLNNTDNLCYKLE